VSVVRHRRHVNPAAGRQLAVGPLGLRVGDDDLAVGSGVGLQDPDYAHVVAPADQPLVPNPKLGRRQARAADARIPVFPAEPKVAVLPA